jgi:hypothetical protein
MADHSGLHKHKASEHDKRVHFGPEDETAQPKQPATPVTEHQEGTTCPLSFDTLEWLIGESKAQYTFQGRDECPPWLNFAKPFKFHAIGTDMHEETPGAVDAVRCIYCGRPAPHGIAHTQLWHRKPAGRKQLEERWRQAPWSTSTVPSPHAEGTELVIPDDE